jgi:anaerobic selenocysteine-containing dehydrogenase
MSAKLSRRTFVKAGAAAGAGLVFLRFAGSAVSKGIAETASDELEWLPNVCNLCPNFCGLKVGVKNTGNGKRVVKIDGDPDNSYSRGHTCARGQAGIRLLYSPDRIKQPLIRVEGSKRGEWKFRAVSWAEAYKYIMETSQKHQIMPWEMTAMGGWLVCSLYGPYLLPFMRALQIPNLVGSTIQRCMYGQVLGINSVLGTFNAHDEVSNDYGNARFALNFRSNANLTSSTGRIIRFAEGLANDTKVVTLDPRLTEAGRPSDVWVPVKPGTDGAFLLAIMHEILTEGTYDADFLTLHSNAPFLAYMDGKLLRLAMDANADGSPARFYVLDQKTGKVVAVPGVSNRNDKSVDGKTVSPALSGATTWKGKQVRPVLDFLKERVAPNTPEWASKICGIDAETVASIAKEFSEASPALIYSGWTDGRYDTSPMTWKTAAMIQALIGGIDKPGGWYYTAKQHRLIAEYAHAQREGKPTLEPELPGMKLPLQRQKTFNDPSRWVHQHPGLSEIWNRDRRAAGKPAIPLNLFSDLGLAESVQGKVTYAGKPYQTKAIGIAATNPVRSFYTADDQKALLGHENVKLVVNIDLLPTDTCAYSDVILPDLSYLEREDVLMDPQSADMTFATRVQAVPPVVDGKHLLDIFFDIAEQMGAYKEYVRLVAVNYDADLTTTLARFNAARKKGETVATVLRELAIEREAPTVNMTAKKMLDSLKKGAITPQTREELVAEMGVPRVVPAPTPSGRIELYSLLFASLTEGAGGYDPHMDPLLSYADTIFRDGLVAGEDLAENEFYMTHGHIATMTHTSTSDNDLLVAISKEKPDRYMRVWINKQKASALGLKDNDTVLLKNTVSGQELTTPVFLTEMIRPDTVFFPSPFGAENKAQTSATGVGPAWNTLVPRRLESIAGGAMSSQFTVKVSKAAEGKG